MLFSGKKNPTWINAISANSLCVTAMRYRFCFIVFCLWIFQMNSKLSRPAQAAKVSVSIFYIQYNIQYNCITTTHWSLVRHVYHRYAVYYSLDCTVRRITNKKTYMHKNSIQHKHDTQIKLTLDLYTMVILYIMLGIITIYPLRSYPLALLWNEVW